jgi:hypothetical protein
LHGLDAAASYEVRFERVVVERSSVQASMGAATESDEDEGDEPDVFTGEFLMNHGLPVRLVGDYASTIWEVVRK